MTYKESYQKCKTLDELKNEVKRDMIYVAMTLTPIGSDMRKKIIEEAVTEVCEEKGWTWVDEVGGE